MKYYVITPPYEVCPTGNGDVCDVEEVEAPNRRQARVIGLRQMRAKHYDIELWADGGNPLGKLKVEPVEVDADYENAVADVQPRFTEAKGDAK